MKEIGPIIKWMVKALINGQTGARSKELGNKAICMVKVYMSGQTVEFTKENTKRTCVKAKES